MPLVRHGVESDYLLLEQLLVGAAGAQNPYQHFDWEKELHQFWKSAENDGTNSENRPLFSYALGTHFRDPTEALRNEAASSNGKESRQLDEIARILKSRDKIVNHPTSKPQPTQLQTQPDLHRVRIGRKLPTIQAIQETYSAPAAEPEYSRALSVQTRSTTRSQSYKFDESMPAISSVGETATFALSNVCGPSMGELHVMDVQMMADTGQ